MIGLMALVFGLGAVAEWQDQRIEKRRKEFQQMSAEMEEFVKTFDKESKEKYARMYRSGFQDGASYAKKLQKKREVEPSQEDEVRELIEKAKRLV